jgi:hypothetical protein
MILPGRGRVEGASEYPSIGDWTIFAAGIENIVSIKSAPNDHFIASPDCCMKVSLGRCIGDARRDPAIRARIIPAPSVRDGNVPAPHDHFIPRPDCGVKLSARWGISRARFRPTIRA